MKLKYLAAFLMLAALGCAQPSSDTTPAADTGSEPAATETDAVSATVEPATETDTDTLLASTSTVEFDVTGMS